MAATYGITVFPCYETYLTGKLGTATAEFRGHSYEVGLGYTLCTRDGKPFAPARLPAAVARHAERQYAYLLAACPVKDWAPFAAPVPPSAPKEKP